MIWIKKKNDSPVKGMFYKTSYVTMEAAQPELLGLFHHFVCDKQLETEWVWLQPAWEGSIFLTAGWSIDLHSENSMFAKVYI